ncbi:MAG TPA: hypothetical protein VFO67_09370 [Gemmatimonadales bacterium]|nr:hypothetical protein [Gemmatimonadales bacterium]
MTVDRCQRWSEQFLAGEMTALEHEAFLRHARSCEACNSLVLLDAELRVAPPVSRLTAAEGDGVRRSVLRQLHALQERRQAAGQRPRGVGTALLAAAAVLLVGVGMVVGRFWAGAARGEDGEALTGLIKQAALGSLTLADVENSPYVFTNVAFRSVDAEQVAVSFDVSRHLELTAHRADPLIRQLVVQAVVNPSPIGSRLKAISYAEGVADRAVMDALLIAMLDDPSAEVRLRALAALAPHKADPEIQSALLTVLTTSDSVPMRLQAIDYLVKGRVDPQRLRSAVSMLDPEEHAALLVRASGYLQ